MNLRKKIVCVLVVALVLIALAFFIARWLAVDNAYNLDNAYSLEIDPNGIYFISWIDHSGRNPMGSAVGREEVEEVISYLNAWSLDEFCPIYTRIGGATHCMTMFFMDEEGNVLGSLAINGLAVVWYMETDGEDLGGRYEVRGNRMPVRRFVERFGWG